MAKKITLVTMSQGNVVALKRTFDSFKNIADEIIYGDLLIFEEDRKIVESYKDEYNLKIVPLPFDYIFHNGFSSLLNLLASKASNELVLYMNCSEVVDGEERILRIINELFPNYNAYAFSHAREQHSWFRCYNPKELFWSGIIHEELDGEHKNPCPYYIFQMADTQKDMDDSFKAKVYDDIKELVYFNNLVKIANDPQHLGATNEYWIEHAKSSYQSLIDRLNKKGKRRQAFEEGDLQMFLNDIYTNPEFENERHESNTIIHFQSDRKLL